MWLEPFEAYDLFFEQQDDRLVMALQLPLHLQLAPPSCSFDSYCAAGNEMAYQVVQKIAQGATISPITYLWGREATGKTHLLQAACREVNSQGKTALYLPLDQRIHFSPDVLDNLEDLDLICLDNIQYVARQADWEIALFSLFNQLQDKGIPLLCSSNKVPKADKWQLPDLISRLNSGQIFHLHPVSRSALTRIVHYHAQAKGLKLTDQVSDYLIQRSQDDLIQVLKTLENLDYASMVKKRRLTLPFVRQMLQNSHF